VCSCIVPLTSFAGKIVNTPEVVRVYTGSFWKQPLQHTANRHLFELEHQDLFKDLQSLPKQNSIRKLESSMTSLGEVVWLRFALYLI